MLHLVCNLILDHIVRCILVLWLVVLVCLDQMFQIDLALLVDLDSQDQCIDLWPRQALDYTGNQDHIPVAYFVHLDNLIVLV